MASQSEKMLVDSRGVNAGDDVDAERMSLHKSIDPIRDDIRRRGHKLFCGRSALVLLISLCNLACFCLKLPFLVFVIRAVLEVLRARAQQAAVSTWEPPYANGEGMVHESEWWATPPTTTPSPSSGSAAKIEVLCLLLLYVANLVVHLDIGCIFFCASKCKSYFHLVLYYIMVGAWLFLATFSYFVQRWPHALSYIFLVFKTLIHGNDLFAPPNNWELALLRASICLDIITYVLTIVYQVLVFWWKKRGMPSHCTHNCKPHYNLIRLL